jgi:DNA helicase-2/ATP-dependent DNA helicase PcrA
VRLLLAERSAQRVGPVREVELPTRLSVSQLVALREDPDELARRLHRPLPARPAPLARRGTAFHLWLEQRWGGEKLLDLDELPGAGDETARTDDDLIALREAFLASPWAERSPHEVEVPFDMVFDGVVVRGRMDAVFADGDGWLVVDWKTGAVPTGAHARAAAVQLAAYRLAWQRIASTPQHPVALESVRAAFHYVPANRTITPADLLDAEGLRRLITSPQESG